MSGVEPTLSTYTRMSRLYKERFPIRTTRTGFFAAVLALSLLLPPRVATGAAVIGNSPSADSRLADAAENRDASLVQSLLKGRADVNGMQADRTTALMWAAHYGDLETLNLLLGAGANPKAVNRYGSSALSEATAGNQVAVMVRLLKAGADANTVSQNNESVLMTAAHTGNVEAIQLLLDHGANINARDAKDQETPLMYAVAEGNHPAVKLLISKGADVNAYAHTLDLPRRRGPSNSIFATRVTGGFSALMFAARQDDVECAKTLLDAGADPNAADRDGMSAMIIAALNGSFETAAAILDKGGDPDDGSLWEAVEFRNYRGEVDDHVTPKMTSRLSPADFVKISLQHGADPTRPYGKIRTSHRANGTNAGNIVTTSALERALQTADIETVRLMVDSAVSRGIAIDRDMLLFEEVRAYFAVDNIKLLFRTLTANDAAEAVKMALEYGANVNAVNAQGVTPMHLAAQQGANDIVRLLAQRGAKLDAKNKAGLTPVDFAMGKGAGPARGAATQSTTHEDTAALLKELMSAAAGASGKF